MDFHDGTRLLLEHGFDGLGTDLFDGTWIFLEHGFNGLDTDFSPAAIGLLEHGLDGLDTDWTLRNLCTRACDAITRIYGICESVVKNHLP
jgi:hypothetical protein